MTSVLQPWVETLTFMQQSVLLACVRGPDGIEKNHVSKLLIRWLRRSFVLSAFQGKEISDPFSPGGGSFTGPSVTEAENWDWGASMNRVVDDYLKTVDEVPHHFQMHFIHAAEILGYKHPGRKIREWWNQTYRRLVNDLHLEPETEQRMDWRLGDKESQWRAAEEVTASGP